MTDEQPVGFARGSIVREFGDGPNMLVVRSSADHTFVVVCEGDIDGTLRAREYPTGDLDQVLGNGAQQDREFDLRWKADMRAIARWRDANPGNDLVMPDHADLVVWLLDQLATGPVMPETPSEAARDVLAERRRQVEVEGWTPEHDDAHSAGEMARAAVCLEIPYK